MATSASSSFSGKIPALDPNRDNISIYYGKTKFQDECEIIYPLNAESVLKASSEVLKSRNEGFERLATPVGRVTRCKSFNGPLSPKIESRNSPWNLRSALTGSHIQRKSDSLRGPLKRNSVVHARRPSEQQSQPRVSFKQIDLSNMHVSMEPPPLSVGRRPFWIMRMIHLTITKGGYLSSRLFVPKDVWTQKGVKFAGAEKKISAMEFMLRYVTEKAVHLPSPNDPVTCQNALEAAKVFHFHASKLREDLTRTFPFVGPSENYQRNSNTKRNFSKFNNMVKTIGRNVKNTASSAYELMGNSGKGSSDGDLSYYGLLVADVCDKCQLFDQWLECAQKLRENGERCRTADELIMEIHNIGNIMREAFVEIVLRDVEMLLDRYIRKMRKSFTQLSWDDQEADD